MEEILEQRRTKFFCTAVNEPHQIKSMPLYYLQKPPIYLLLSRVINAAAVIFEHCTGIRLYHSA